MENAKDHASTEEKRKALQEELAKAYDAQLDETINHTYNRFVSYIANSELPLTHVLMVLEMLKKELMDQAIAGYLKR